MTERKRIDDELKLSLQRLDLAQRAGHIGVFDRDIQSDRLIWNEEEHRIFGIEPGAFEGTIEGWAKRLVPEDAAGMHRDMQEAIAKRQAEMAFSFRVVRPDGATRWVEGSAQFVYSPQGKPLRMVGVNVDVTKRRETENALRAADRRKNEFLATLSHELRNPLAAICNALQLCETVPDEETFRWSRNIMKHQVAQLSRLVDDLLDVTRINTGKIQVRAEPLDLAQVFDHAVAAAKPLITERRHELILSVSRAAFFIRGDAARLEQVVVNVLTNAAKYTPPGGKIWLKARRENTQIAFSIRDNGIGIAPGKISEMFDLFAQGQRSITRSEGGFGIGLTIARTLVEMHGGTIDAHSDGEGKGAEFIIRLPAAASAIRAPDRIARSAGSATTRSARILVVDDHVDTAQTIARLLRARGHTIEIAYDGLAAVAVPQVFQPQIVLLDLGLPGMDGYEVAQHLRAHAKGEQPTIIAATGYGQDEDRQRSDAAGIDHHLVKPVTLDRLDALLTESQTP